MKKTTKVLTALSIVALTLFTATLDSKADTSDGILNTNNANISRLSNNSDINGDNSSNVARIRRVREIDTSAEEEEEDNDIDSDSPETSIPETESANVTVSDPETVTPEIDQPSISVVPVPHITNKGSHFTYITDEVFNKKIKETATANNISVVSDPDDDTISNGESTNTITNKIKMENNNVVTGKKESKNPDRTINNNYNKMNASDKSMNNKKVEVNSTKNYRKTIGKITSKLPKTGDSSVALSATAGLGSILSIVFLRKKKK